MADPAPSGPRSSTRRRDTRDPRRARERALKILFQADLRSTDPVVVLDRIANDPSARSMLDDLDDLAGEQAAADALRTQARADAAAGTTLDDDRPRVAPIDAFTRRLVLGVSQHRAEIDRLIESYARRWSISRMPVVDRTVLRVATFELAHEDTSAAVVINEAVELAKSLSTEDSGRYVNGVLESIRRHVAGEGDVADLAPIGVDDAGEDAGAVGGPADAEGVEGPADAEGVVDEDAEGVVDADGAVEAEGVEGVADTEGVVDEG